MLTYKEYVSAAFDQTNKLQIIEIEIPKGGSEVTFDVDSLTSMEQVLGIALINPNPDKAGHGTLKLRIGDEEILPDGFSADLISKFSSRFVNTRLKFAFKHYIFPTQVRAKGKPVKVAYTEPTDGNTGKLYLYLLGTKCCHKVETPKFRFQIVEATIPKGEYSTDTEVVINEKTVKSHERVVGAVFLGATNRIKKVSLSIDGTSIFPDGMVSPLVFKEAVNSSSISGGIFTKHILPLPFMLHPCNVKAQDSKIEGNITAIPHPAIDYKAYLYLLTVE